MKRILINATHNEEIRVALCKDNHLYDFDLENRTREQKKANIYKGHVTRVEPSLEAVFVEYGSTRQGFLPLREIAPEYLKGNPRNDNIRDLIKEGDEVIIQIEKEERGNKGAAVSTFISLAGRYLVLMPNNHKAGGISRQISGKVREEMKQIISSLSIPQGMSVIVRTAGIGKGFEDLQNDLNHLLTIWSSILEQNRTRPSPCLVHQEAGVVTRAVRDYLRDDIGEIWIDSENAYNEAANFIASVMPNQMGKLRKYTDYEPLFVRFGIERQIETAYQREVRLPSGGSIVIDQTEAMVAIDINSAKSTKGSDVAETAYHTNLEAAEEIARQLRLRDMGGLIVIDFIDMADPAHQKEVEKRLIDATRYDRARVQFAEISKFGLMEMSRQRLRPSLEEATGYLCPRCHGNGMIRDLRSLALSIMRQIEQIALQERVGEIQVEVPIEVSAFLLNEKRESLVYLEQDSGVRVTILPHAHLESPNFSLHFNPDGFAPSSYERVVDTEERESVDRGYEVNWQTKHEDTPQASSRWQQADSHSKTGTDKPKKAEKANNETPAQPQAVAWLSNLFAPKPQARLAHDFGSNDVASAIEALVNGGATSLGSFGNVAPLVEKTTDNKPKPKKAQKPEPEKSEHHHKDTKTEKVQKVEKVQKAKPAEKTDKDDKKYPKREANSQRTPRGEVVRGETLEPKVEQPKTDKVQKAKPADKDNTEKAKKADNTQKAPRQTNPDEVVVHISTVEEVQTPTRTVHLSLDNSKPKKVAQTSDDVTHADKSDVAVNAETLNVKNIEAISEPATTIAEPVSEQISETTNSQTQDVATNVENVATESIATTKETVEAVVHGDVMASDVDTDSAINDEQATTHDNHGHDESKPTNHEQPTQKAKLTKVRPALPKPVAHAFDTDYALKVQALANEQGRAMNDPRVVQSLVTTPIATTVITGTAGEFVRAMLGDTASDETFVARFLLAMNAFDNAKNAPVATAFDFTNYGFAPLSDEYRDAFAHYVEPLGQFGTPQGKTEVTPNPIGERAINDPRGQYVPVEAPVETSSTPSEPITEQIVENEQPAKSEAVKRDEPTPTATVSEPADSVDNFIDSTLESMDKMFDSAESAIESLVHTLEEIIKPVEKKNKKDKVSSYKDMIENVSGQLLPPTGILSLVAPKKPKATKPKTAKTANRKITQKAQNAQVVKKPKTDTDNTDGETGGENPVGE